MIHSLNDPHMAQYGNSAFGTSVFDIVANALYHLPEEDVIKALNVGGKIGGGSADPLRGESLDAVVQNITLHPRNFTPMLQRFYNFMAKSTVEEAALLTRLGRGKFSYARQGDLGPQDASEYERIYSEQRYMGQVGGVTRTAMRATAAAFGDLKAREATNRLHKLLLDMERDILWGDTRFNELAISGLFEQLPSTAGTNKISLRQTGTAGARTTITGGANLTVAAIRESCENALNYGGMPTALYCSPKDKISLAAQEDNKIRWYKEGGKSEVAPGMIVDQVENPLGRPLDIVYSIWLSQHRGERSAVPRDPSNAALFHEMAPNQPGTNVIPLPVAGGHLPNNTYYYAYSYLVDEDEGPVRACPTGGVVNDTNGKLSLALPLPQALTGINSVRVYRSTEAPANKDDFSKFRLLDEYAVPSNTTPGGTLTVVDDGTVIPGSRRALLMDEEATSLPFLNKPEFRDLSDIDNTHRFTVDVELSLFLLDKGLRQVQFCDIGGSVENPVLSTF